MDFGLLLEIWVKMSVNIKVKTYAINAVRNFLIMPNNLLQIQSKQLQKAIQEVAEATGDLIGNKIADKLQEPQKNHQ